MSVGYFETTDQLKIYYESYNDQGSSTILLVHGFQCSSRFFYKNIEQLSKQYRVVLIDLRCHGNSVQLADDISLKRMGKDVKELIKFLHLEKVHLFGWSMGGNVVMEYHKQFGSQHLASIGFIDSRLFPYSSEAWNTHSCRDFNLFAANKRKEKMLEDYDFYCRNLVDRYYVVLPEQQEKLFVINELLKTDGETMWAIYEDFLKDDCYSELKNIDIPVLVVASRHIGDDTGKHYLSMVKTGTYKWFSCGHCMMLESPEEFNNTILEFIK